MFYVTRPRKSSLDRLLAEAGRLPLSYEPVGLAHCAEPAGYLSAEERVTLGYGPGVHARALRALEQWRHFELGWTSIYPPLAPVQTGTVVLVVARHLGFWSVNACRIVYLLGDKKGQSPAWGTVPPKRDCPSDRGQSLPQGQSLQIAGFAYGTLTEHAEAGEEIFQVSFNPANGEVTYVVRAVSRERALLARFGFPIARALQARFRRDSAAALQRFVSAP